MKRTGWGIWGIPLLVAACPGKGGVGVDAGSDAGMVPDEGVVETAAPADDAGPTDTGGGDDAGTPAPDLPPHGIGPLCFPDKTGAGWTLRTAATKDPARSCTST